jgi:hypothetical protein
MIRISETLLTSDKLNENDKIMVMLFAATCSELELKVWRMMQEGESLSTITIYNINNCLLRDMGISAEDQEGIATVEAMSPEFKNEKVQDAARKVENFFRAIGVKANENFLHPHQRYERHFFEGYDF